MAELANGYKIQINENVSGFMPFYLSSKSKDEKLKRGLIVEFYILEASESDGLRLILDRRTLERERDLAKRIELVNSYKEEDVVDGVVDRITEYGAIVKIKNFVTGILHKRNIAFNQVENIEDFVRVGDKLKLKIIKINPQTGKMELSLKALKVNPWDSVDIKYKIDSIVKGKVVKFCLLELLLSLIANCQGFYI